ncbi:MAG: alpha/beta fold hydrolase [Acidobacteria bacterium]|nr:alpha/beta fold hydrolase [Acidobacteriota bacterium]
MKSSLRLKTIFIGLLLLAAAGCGSRNSPPAPAADANSPAANSGNANPPNAAKPAPPQTVKFESAGKAEIAGAFYESPKADAPAVLLLHQWQSDRKSYDDFARRLQAKGFNVLAIDGRGFGESVRTADGQTIAPARDADAVKAMQTDVDNAFQFLSKQKNVDPGRVGIVGASYGSSLAILYAAGKKDVKAVALLSPGLNYFGNMATEPAVKSYGDRALLLVAAEDDKESADAVRKLKDAGANEKYETQIYPQGGHGTALFEVGLADLLEKFLTKSL